MDFIKRPLRLLFSILSSFFFLRFPKSSHQIKPVNDLSSSKEKVVVIMAPTASGKSRLSVQLATRFPSEIINSDKLQFYKGLDITVNKMPLQEQRGVPHHLLGNLDSPTRAEVTAAEFRSLASSLISDITVRGKLPIVVGGSNSFVYALLAKQFNPDLNIFSGSAQVCSELMYNCCLLWIDVALPVLSEYIKKRVDDMLASGMLNEVADFLQSETDNNIGLAKAIGVPEFEEYVKTYGKKSAWEDDEVQRGAYEKAVKAIKDNTCMLAKTQAKKIKFLKEKGWNIKRLDATTAFKALLEGSKTWSIIWEAQVVEPSVKTIKSFLET